jgi:hypothetical protein
MFPGWLPMLTLLLVVGVFLGQAHFRVQGELARMVDESWAGGPVNATLVDAVSEELTIGAARIFREVGFSPTSGLPCYEGFVSETPILGVLETGCAYTHFLPGPEYALLVLFAVFGDSDEALMRMRIVPLLLVLIAALCLVIAARRRVLQGWSLGAVFLLAGVLAAPGVHFWSLSIYGHSYSNACILGALALGLSAGPSAAPRKVPLFVAAFLVGVLSNLFLLEGAFVVCAAPLVGGLLSRGAGSRKLAASLSVVVGLGLVFVMLLHVAQVAHHLDSLSLALKDQFGTAALRAESRHGPGRLAMIGAFSDGATTMYGISALAMLGSGLLACWLQRNADGQRLRFTVALLLSAGAAYLFPILLKHHTVLHLYRVPRVFLLLFVVWLICWLVLVRDRLTTTLGSAN